MAGRGTDRDAANRGVAAGAPQQVLRPGDATGSDSNPNRPYPTLKTAKNA
jgi:hypothetical protein